jgi:hypothetical protein
MSCRSELDCQMYVDHELPADETMAFEAHLAACAPCRQRCDALRGESELIASALSEPELVPGPNWRALAWAALGLVAATAGVQTGLDQFEQLGTLLGWLNPLAGQQQLSALFAFLFLLTQEDIPMLFTPVAALTTFLLLGATLALVTRRRSAAIAGLLLLLAAATPTSATEFRAPTGRPNGIVIIPAGETINDSVMATGQQVIVEGTITGDLIALAEQVRVSGEVRGSLVALAKSVSIDGVVKGDVYSAGQTIDVHGQVERNVHAAANSLDIAGGARIANDAWLASQYGRVSGAIGRDLHAAGQSFALTGAIGRAVRFSGQDLDLGQTARVSGEITASVPGPGSVLRAPAAQLASEPQIRSNAAEHKVRGPMHTVKRWLTLRFYFWQAVRIAAAMALGLLLYWLIPALFQSSAPTSAGRLLRNAGVGFLALVATPIAALLLAITLVGLPIAVLAMGVWLVGLYLAGVFVALVVGQLILRSTHNGARSFILALLLGLALTRIAVNLPFVGGVCHFILIIVGLGLLAAQLRQLTARLRSPAVA